MSLVTGTPLGNVDTQESIYLESAPSIYFQDYTATPLKNPDSDGFYWGLSGTSTYPAFEIGCPLDVAFGEGLTSNDVRCDNQGMVDTVRQRDYVELTFTVQSFFPLTTLTHLLSGGAVTTNLSEHTEKMGLGTINNNKFYHVYAPKVYDTDTGDYLLFHLHKAKFVDAWTITTPFGSPWKLAGLKLRAYRDATKPDAQAFGVIVRADASVI